MRARGGGGKGTFWEGVTVPSGAQPRGRGCLRPPGLQEGTRVARAPACTLRSVKPHSRTAGMICDVL